ncbi:MAG TPA: hypothetical protein VK735_36110 [Pseudonocardia sp.]|jgi:hypothetical protein|uniref:hypothetical protein n=1 Tax=Pseudonocardia sp. TaxID=60912 RepID=UPI002B6BDD04|nr:hypothetical protein [Pseudonocardia sp.]HTF52901.1 hypothetical protein [Pseudonocardia sp.]
MHTMVVRMTLDPTRPDEVDRHFREFVVPWAKEQPGFVSGRWLRGVRGETGMGVVTFASEDAANTAAATPRSIVYPEENAWSIAGVEIFEQVVEA